MQMRVAVFHVSTDAIAQQRLCRLAEAKRLRHGERLTLQVIPLGSSGLGTALFSKTLAPLRSLCRSPREWRYFIPSAISARHNRQQTCAMNIWEP